MKTFYLFWLFSILLFPRLIYAQVTHQLTGEELYSELRTALQQNNDAGCIELLRNHRLLIKPFVERLITESIRKELKGKPDEAEQLSKMAAKTAEFFNTIFNEKSLLFAVNYLTIWSKGQKEIKLTADSLYAAGTKFRLGNEPEKAIDLFEKVLTLYKSIGDERGESEVLGGFGALYYNNVRDFQTAFNYYEKALAKREKVDDKILVGNTLSSIGSLYHDYFSDYPKAITYLSRAEKIRDESGDLVNLGRTIHVKASAFEKNGQLDSALNYFTKSFELNSLAGDKPRMAQAMLHSGEILNNTGRYQEALDCLDKSVSLYKELKSRNEEGYALSQVGFVYSNIGDLNSAIEKINQAAGIMKETNDPEGLAGVYNHFGIVLREAGRYEKALDYYLLAQEIYKQKENKILMLPLLSNIGNVYLDLKDFTKAEDYHTQGLQLSRELNSRLEEVHLLLNLANDQIFLNLLDESMTSYKTGLKKAESMNSPDLIWRFYVGMAENHERRGNYQRAVELNDSALKILGGMRNTLQTREQKESFMASEKYIYEDIISLLENLNEKDAAKDYDRLAFQYAEESKSRVLLDLLSGSSSGKANGTNNTDSGNLALHYPEPISIDEAKLLCTDKKMVILEYAVGDTSSCLWVINRSGFRLFRLPGRKELQEKIETIRFGLLDPNQGISDFFTKAGASLYQDLISPAEPFLSKKSRLVIIPDGVLNYLPFEVLLTENKESAKAHSTSGIPFLVIKYPVSYAQSASVLKELISQKNNTNRPPIEGRKLLAFGDPLYEDTLYNGRVKYPRLEFSGKEIENIASFFPAGSAEVFIRNRATEEDFRQNNALNKFSYLHFATHGLINEDNPELSSLVLTSQKNSGEDGFLKASEIFNLNLNADLVVLSACQTGLGKLVKGEGMVGLTRAFMFAGTPSVLVSLWSVSDMSTASLMSEFYKNLIKNKLSKTDALRKAQLTLIGNEKYAHPFYWAPFILVGDWR